MTRSDTVGSRSARRCSCPQPSTVGHVPVSPHRFWRCPNRR